jgi:hypothetical protein
VKHRFNRDPCIAHVACWIGVQGQRLQPDKRESLRFLRRLDPGAGCFSFRTFSDSAYTRLSARDPLEDEIHGSLEACWERLVALNRQGAAISVTVNLTDGSGRGIADIRRIRALFVDDDWGGDPQRFHLQPHIRVETSPGHYHYYWLVEGVSVQDFPGYQHRLAERYGGDSRVQALNQSMQLPGFWRRKRITQPLLPRVLEISDHEPFQSFELREFLGLEVDPNH